ncbi:MAG: hypothetical protein KDD89_07400 [Anaerolineales bacterium]|nr:hypothetical protein [Anaerolineales bacterium]
MAENNLLRNSDLNLDFAPFRGEEKQLIPAGWGPWWEPPPTSKSAPSWQNNVPRYDFRYLDGDMVTVVSSPFATHTAGLFQQIPVVAGESYELNVEVQAWSSEAEEAGVIHDGSDVNLQIGLDPTGGLDGRSPLIHWSQPQQALGKWLTLRLTATAQASVVTLFLKSAPYLPKRQQMIFWRRASCRPVGRYKRATSIVGPGDTHIQLDVERPHPVQEITAVVSALRPHKMVELEARRPSGEPVAVTFEGVRQEDDRYFWQYKFTVEDEGLYDLRFLGDKGARLLAQRLVKAAREVQIVPSGKPRLDFRRVYVLLPPTADETWLLAAAQGSYIGRYTIGFSADDAGVGEVAERIVICINPHHWPETLTSVWYDHHYPGTRFIPVVANSPADLQAWLEAWLDE